MFWLAVVSVAIAAAVWGPHFVWTRLRTRRLGVVVLDKTVPFRRYREHQVFPWLLHAMKISHPGGGFLDATRDYAGFDPIAHRGRDLSPDALHRADVLFIADTYGVYRGDYQRPGEIA